MKVLLNMVKSFGRYIASIIATIGVILTSVNGIVFAESEGTGVGVNVESTTVSKNSYFDYYLKYKETNRPQEMISVETISDIKGSFKTENISGEKAVVLDADKPYAEWNVEIPESGLYSVFIDYYPLEGTGKDILLSAFLDDNLPYTEAADLSLPRIWKDAVQEDGTTIIKDSAGNDCRPRQVEAPRWCSAGLKDLLGLYEEPYLFYMESGSHRIRLQIKRESMAIKRIQIGNQIQAMTYSNYIAQYDRSDYAAGDKAIRLEAESALDKNSSMLYPTYDKSNPATLPSDPGYIRINSIGGNNWRNSGDAISWVANVPEDGLYQLSFRSRQYYSEGLNSYRKLYINGKVPFKEAEKIVFPYSQSWYIKTLGDETPLYVYLKKGDVITLECNSSEMSMPMREIQQAVLELNDLYRSIIMVTGTSPDIYQDYALESQIPGLVESMKDIHTRLQKVAEHIMNVLGKSCSEAATIKKTIDIVKDLADDPYFIPDRLSSFKGSIDNLSSLLLKLGGQPLELDCLYFVPAGTETPAANLGFFSNFSFGLKKFLSSFTGDYNSIGSAGNWDQAAVTVWAAIGRDQAQIISRLTEETFSSKTGIPVSLKMITGNMASGDNVVIKATLAGQGPDVALSVVQTTPINLAARGALVDLCQYDISKLKQETYASAWTPFEYNGGIYALPETQSFDVLFYRTDIFESLGLTPPKTWDAFYDMMEVIQSKNLQVAWPEVNPLNQGTSAALAAFDKFLFQSGGQYFNSQHNKTMFDTEAAYQAFERTVDLYRVFGLSRDISFFNRFRSGEAPVGIANYTTYTQLVASAPELRGLWSFSLVPGTPVSGGGVDHTESSAVTGCVMFKSAKERGVDQQAFTFLNWWTSAETQTQYGKELEGILGIIGRIAPANKVALSNLGWTSEELDIIQSQMQWVKNPEQVLGNYAIERSLTSALRSAINDENTARRSLDIYNRKINEEILRKRTEFKLD